MATLSPLPPIEKNHRIGLEPKWYIGAYRKYLTELIHMLAERYAGEPARYAAAIDAVLKVVLFDMSLALDTYFHHEHSQTVSEHQAAQHRRIHPPHRNRLRRTTRF